MNSRGLKLVALAAIVFIVTSCSKSWADAPNQISILNSTPVSTADIVPTEAYQDGESSQYDALRRRNSQLKEIYVNTECVTVVTELYEVSTEGAEITGYFDGENYIAITAHIFGEFGKSLKQIYISENYTYIVTTSFDYNRVYAPYYEVDAIAVVDCETRKYSILDDVMYELDYVAQKALALPNDALTQEMDLISTCIEVLEKARNGGTVK